MHDISEIGSFLLGLIFLASITDWYCDPDYPTEAITIIISSDIIDNILFRRSLIINLIKY